MWEQTGCLCTAVLLACHSVTDIRRQCIPRVSLAVGVLISCGWAMGKSLLGMQSWVGLGVGILPGFITLLLARVTREQVGRGDGWELIIMGNSMGLASCLLALGTALLGIFLLSVVLLVLGKAGRSTRIAFVPFLEMGVVVVLLRNLILSTYQ